MFIYGRLPGTDTKALVNRCLETGVAFVPGSEFYPQEPVHDEMRLNFTHTNPEQMKRGIGLIAGVNRELLMSKITGSAKATA